MSSHPSLLSIIAYARSGALEYACRLFEEGGFDRVGDDPAVLSVRARLLKDRALATSGVEQRRLYHQSADIYAKAGKIGGQTYPLINAATLSLLAGERAKSLTRARALYKILEAGGDELETPYYRVATHAEALLLLGDITQARQMLADAIAVAPRAYEDHASTLRQFGLILDALGEDAAWLDPLRPPRSLHFAAHGSIQRPSAKLTQALRELISGERIGYAFGALASAADVRIAEILIHEGVELHAVLPGSEKSLQRITGGGRKALAAVLHRAASVRIIDYTNNAVSPGAISLASQVAMGSALMQANTLMTEAVQFVMRSASTSRVAALWNEAGRRQALHPGGRSRRSARGPSPGIAAMLRIDLADVDPGRLAQLLKKIFRASSRGPAPLLPIRWTGEAVLATFASAASAATVAQRAADALAGTVGGRVAGHFALANSVVDPFSGRPFPDGPGVRLLAQIVRSVPSGAIHLTEDFAAALHAEAGRRRPRTEYIGDLPADSNDRPVRLFSLKP